MRDAATLLVTCLHIYSSVIKCWWTQHLSRASTRRDFDSPIDYDAAVGDRKTSKPCAWYLRRLDRSTGVQGPTANDVKQIIEDSAKEKQRPTKGVALVSASNRSGLSFG